MRRAFLALALCCALCLTGCSALLDRPYAAVEPHTEQPAAGDGTPVQVSTYSELVNAVLFFVSQGTEEGTLQLVDYGGEVEEDLNRACLEVAKDDPLGAYAVDFIKNEYTRVLATYEATVTISYRRTREQINSLVNVTGASAIRDEVGQALAGYQNELALRVGYFTADAGAIAELVRQAYYDNPLSALGMPEFTVSLYPETGSQRIVEILLTYPESADTLRRRRDELREAADALLLPHQAREQTDAARRATLFALAREAIRQDPAGGSTAWDALVGNGADSEGTALAFQLLADGLEVGASLVEGTLDGAPHFWNRLTGDGGAHYVDQTRVSGGVTYSAADLAELGYVWEDMPAAEDAENLQ